MTFRLALDQNFPLNIVKPIAEAVPLGMELMALRC